jgi:hypothetical protein
LVAVESRASETGANPKWQIQRGAFIQGENGRIKPNAVPYNGDEYTVGSENGRFQIRQFENGKSIYTNRGSDIETAVAPLVQLRAKAITYLANLPRLGTVSRAFWR